MDSKRAGGVAIFGVIVLIAIWGLLSLLPGTAAAPRTQGEQASTAGGVDAATAPEVTVSYSRQGSVHTYEGTIDTPTACHSLVSSTSAAYGTHTSVTIALSVIKPEPGAVCAQVITPQKFATSVTSKSEPVLTVTINGKPAKVVLAGE
jgi:hypothetical protein